MLMFNFVNCFEEVVFVIKMIYVTLYEDGPYCMCLERCTLYHMYLSNSSFNILPFALYFP